MPELPDVEVFRRYLDATSLHQRIESVEVEPALLERVSRRRLVDTLSRRELQETHRHGKWLLARIGDGPWLTLHFGMTGSLSYARHEEPRPDHVRLRLSFVNGYHLAYECQRKLGRVELVADPDELPRRHDLGPDALDIERDRFVALLRGRGGVKAALMRQSGLAGIGNIYADEILFQARLHPETGLADLDDGQRRALHRAMRRVLGTAIERLAEPGRLPRRWLLPRRTEGAACPRGDGRIERVSVASRSSYVCSHCQRRPR